MVRCLRQLMLGNNDIARCDFVWRQPGLKRHLPGRLPDNTHDPASLRSYVVQLVPEFTGSSRTVWTVYCLRMITTLIRLAYVVRHGFETPGWALLRGPRVCRLERRVNCNANASCMHQGERPNSRASRSGVRAQNSGE